MNSFKLKNFAVDVQGLRLTQQNVQGEIAISQAMMDILVYLATHPRSIIKLTDIKQALFQQQDIDADNIRQMLHQLAIHFGDGQQIIQLLEADLFMLTADPEFPQSQAIPAKRQRPRHNDEISRKKLFLLSFLAILTVIAMMLTLLRSQPEPARQQRQPQLGQIQTLPVLAVLPFAFDGTSSEHNYLGDSLSEVLTNRLATIKNVDVITRTSAFSYRHTYSNGNQIGTLLGAHYVIQGQVQRDKFNLILDIELLSTISDLKIWSKRYTQPFNELTQIHNTLTRDLVEQVALAHAIELKQPDAITATAESFERYLRGLHQFHQNNKSANRSARQWFEAAIESNSLKGRVHTALAKTYVQQYHLGIVGKQTAINLAESTLAETQRLEQTADIYATYGLLNQMKNNTNQAQAYYHKALENDNNNAQSNLLLGQLHYDQQNYKAASQFLLKAQKLDPRDALVNIIYGRTLLYMGQLDNGIEQLTRALESDTQQTAIAEEIAHWYYRYGIFDKTVQWAQVALASTPDSISATMLKFIGQNDLTGLQQWIKPIKLHAEQLDRLAQFFYRHDQRQAIDDLLQSQTLEDLSAVKFWSALLYVKQGEFALANRQFDELYIPALSHQQPGRALMIFNQQAFIAGKEGKREQRQHFLAKARQQQEQWIRQGLRTPYFVSEMIAYLLLSGEKVKAQQLLRNANDKGWQLTHLTHSNPIFTLLE